MIRSTHSPACWLGALVIGLASCLPVSAQPNDYNLPDLGQPADTAMSPAQEKKLGAQVVAQLQANNRVITDPELEEYLNRIGNRLARHTARSSDDALRFYVVDSPDINAFALPGGYIGINAGLLTATRTESELASVMAHEIAHVTQRHIARQMAESQGDTITTMAAALAAAVVGSQAGGGSDAAMAAIMGGMSRLGMQQLSYTRANEYEADRVGIHTLAEAGYDPHAMTRFFGTLQRQSDLYGRQLPQILLSHPVTSTRMAEAEARAAAYPDQPGRESPEYPYMKARARMLSASSPTQARDYFADSRAGADAPALDYGYALGLIRTSNEQQAIDILRNGMARHPDIPAWPLALANALEQSGDITQAGQVLTDARQRFPDDDAVQLAYAGNLADGNDYAAMRDFLLSRPALLNTYPQAQQMLARAAGQTDDLGEAYFRQARYFAMRNDYPRAINQLRTALQTADLGDYNRARLTALRDQMVDACHRAYSASECRRAVAEGSQY